MFDTYVQKLNWRYATQKFDTTKKIAPELLDTLMESMRLTPSSFGLQPWKFLVISNPAIREKLFAASQQPKIKEASHLIVLCARTNMDEAYIKHFITVNAQINHAAPERLAGFQDMLLKVLGRMTPEQQLQWNKRQVYIALGFLLAVCAQHDVDAGPMEGFNAEEFDKILQLQKENLTATVLCAVGYRDPSDPASKQEKVRFSADEVVEWYQ
jgi:nitroreductase / dihydropteridine reductase